MSSKEHPDFTKNPYIIQSLLLLLAPALFAASIYMILGRLVVRLGADSYSIIKPKWLTKFFILGDVLSFFTQGGGGTCQPHPRCAGKGEDYKENNANTFAL